MMALSNYCYNTTLFDDGIVNQGTNVLPILPSSTTSAMLRPLTRMWHSFQEHQQFFEWGICPLAILTLEGRSEVAKISLYYFLYRLNVLNGHLLLNLPKGFLNGIFIFIVRWASNGFLHCPQNFTDYPLF